MSDETTKEAKVETKKAAKLVKVKALRNFAFGGRIVNIGEHVEVDEVTATEVTRDVMGPYKFRGERIDLEDSEGRHNLKRAELVA